MHINLIREINIDESFEHIIEVFGVSQEVVENISQIGIALLPSIERNGIFAFPIDIDEFYHYCKSKDIEIGICAEGNPPIIELCSAQIRVGKILVKKICLPILLGVLGNFVYDKLYNTVPQQPQSIKQEYQVEPTVSFTIAVIDSCGVVTKEYSYDGPAKDIHEVTKHIETLWNGNADK